MTAPALSSSSLSYIYDEYSAPSASSSSSRTPQRSSSLSSHKGHGHSHPRSNDSTQKKKKRQYSPLLGRSNTSTGSSSSHSDNMSQDDDEIPLHTRPASFAAPPSASSRYNHNHPSLAAMMDASHLSAAAGNGYNNRSSNNQMESSSSSGYRDSRGIHDPTPSTSRLPYVSGSDINNNSNSTSNSNNLAFPPHTANALTSSQHSHYQHNGQHFLQAQSQPNQSQLSYYHQPQQPGGSTSSLLNTTRSRQDSNGSSSSTGSGHGNSRFMQSHTPRRSRSVENNNEAAASSSSLSHLRPLDNNTNFSSSSSNHSQGSSSSRSRAGNNVSSGMAGSSSGGGGGGGQQQQQQSSSNTTSSGHRKTSQLCAKCNQPMTGQFVRALGAVFHLDCFRCQDCNKIVAAKFFPVDGADGKQYPLCETDYFRRLSLICAKCGMALRGSYITALDMKFHVEHFTCSVCPTVFGPQDSYYEHGGQVYCHFHYSTRFAVKCTGCKTAILKQFVEINRNNVDEHWHPECYMIHKFWNIKLVPSSKKQVDSSPTLAQDASNSAASGPDGEKGSSPQSSQLIQSNSSGSGSSSTMVDWTIQEKQETAATLRDKQKHVEAQVYRIWTVLSTFEESSAACISEMLRHVSNGHYLDGVKMAEKFVLHVETLFAAIDDLNAAFRHMGSKEIPHVREARMLCKKVVNFFSLLSHTHEAGARKMGITQDLLSLVTGLAHYLKILIRIALTAALKLERDYGSKTALSHFLSRLDRLCRDPDIAKAASSPITGAPGGAVGNGTGASGETGAPKAIEAGTGGTKSRPCGYKSLIRPGGSFINQAEGDAITDLCEACHLTVEEECARFGTNLRWHLQCLSCSMCHRHASKEKDSAKLAALTRQQSADSGEPAQQPIYLKEFRIELFDRRPEEMTSSGSGRNRESAGRIFCSECPSGSIQDGFEYVTRLEQYAFLLCVALNKLYYLLKRRGVLASSPSALPQVGHEDDERSMHEAYRDSSDIKRMKSVNLDRKISATAKVAQRATVVESPRGRTATAQATTGSEVQQSRPEEPTQSIRHVQPQQQQQTSPYLGSNALLPPSTSPLVPQREVVSGDMQHALYQRQQQHQQHQQMPQNQQQQQYLHPQREVDPNERPGYNRTNTAIRVVEDQPLLENGAFRDMDLLGSERSPIQDEDGITLADLHQVMEAEQAREQHGSVPRHSQMLLSELSALEYFIVKHAAAITLASDLPPYRDFEAAGLDELLDIIDAKKNNFWGKLFKGANKDKKEVKKKGIFGVPLEILVERHGTDSMLGAGPGSVRVPTFIDDAITALKQMDLSVEGIFRKNGNIRRLKELTEAIDRDPDSVNLSDDNPVQIAALLKKFLRELPDPLLTFRLQHLFLATQHIENDEDRRKVLHLVMCLMPKPNRDTMEVLSVFLKWVASFSHIDEETGSKMDLQNLATVICPNILYSRGKDASKDESFLGIRAVAEMLQFQDELFTVPQELAGILSDQDLFSNPAELSSKDILKKAEVHIREQQRQRERGSPYEQQQPAFKSGFRGEVKHTHPRYHAPFSPAANQRQLDNGPAGPNTSPRFNGSERPVSFQAMPLSHSQQQQQQQQLAQHHGSHQQSGSHPYQHMPTSPYGNGMPSGMLSPGSNPNYRPHYTNIGQPPNPNTYRPSAQQQQQQQQR